MEALNNNSMSAKEKTSNTNGHRVVKEWWSSGKIKSTTSHKGNLLHRECKKWDEDGQLELRGIYKNDKLVERLPLDDDTTQLTVKKKKGLRL